MRTVLIRLVRLERFIPMVLHAAMEAAKGAEEAIAGLALAVHQTAAAVAFRPQEDIVMKWDRHAL